MPENILLRRDGDFGTPNLIHHLERETMKLNGKTFFGVVATLSLMLVGNCAMAAPAAGTITYTLFVQAIPTLSQSMLVVLSLVLAMLAYRGLRNRSTGKALSTLLAFGVLALAGVSGTDLIHDAQAISLGFVSSSGGVVTVPSTGEFQVQNTSGAAIQISAVTGSVGLGTRDTITSGTPRCTVGLVVQNGGSCYINFIVYT